MPIFKVKLIKKTSASYKTTSFYFSKPADLKFRPGQYLKLSLINPQKNDLKGNLRSLSIASAPHEEDLMITIRMRNSNFKQELDQLPIGSEVEIQAPLSMFYLKDGTNPVVFLSGGVGVAAVRPMLLTVLAVDDTRPIYLFNSNRNLKDIPYYDELTGLKNPNFHYIPTLTRKNKENTNWNGERGYINSQMLQKHLPDPQKATYFLIGPPGFMWGMYKVLQELGIKENQINFDEFTGY